MAINDFGVTAATAAAKVGRLTLSSSTAPTSAEVDSWIEEYAAELNTALDSNGVDSSSLVDSGDTQRLYRTCRGMLKKGVAADIHAVNQNGDTELALKWSSVWNAFVLSLYKAPHRLLGDQHDHKQRSNRTTGPDPAFSTPTWTKGMDL